MGAFEGFFIFNLLYINVLRLYFVPIILTTKSYKNTDLRRLSLSRYNLFLRDSMTNSCRYG